MECLKKSAIIVICFEMRYEVFFLFCFLRKINKCPISDSKQRENLMFNPYLCISRLLLRLTEKCRIFLISQPHPAVNFCNLEAGDFFCKCCLPDACIGTTEALADRVEEHMAPIWIQIGGHSMVIQLRCPLCYKLKEHD